MLNSVGAEVAIVWRRDSDAHRTIESILGREGRK
jgi:hypothetical protein